MQKMHGSKKRSPIFIDFLVLLLYPESMHRSILIDASHLGVDQPTGVELYVDSLLPHLFAELQKHGFTRVHLISTRENPPQALPEYVLWQYAPAERFWGQRVITRWVKKLKPDLYFTPSGVPPLFSSVPTIFTAHDLSFYHQKEAYSVLQHIRLRGLERLAAKNAVALCVPSLFVADELKTHWQIPPEKIFCTPLALPEERTSKSKKPAFIGEDPFILYMGRIEHKKNLQTLVRAFVPVADKRNVTLVLAGKDGVGAVALKSTIAQLPLSIQQKISVTGYVLPEEKRWLYEHAELCVVPCPLEGFGLPVLEGFAAQVPVICADAGAAPEVAGSAALLVPALNHEAWTKSLYSGLDDRALRKQLRYAGMQRLAKFTWAATAQATARTFDQALRKL